MAARTTTKTTRARGAGPRSNRAPAKRPAARSRYRSRGSLGRGVRATWGLLARGAGGLARAFGRTRQIDPAHRRDGVALGLVAGAMVIAAGVWWAAGGPIGAGVQRGLRASVGSAAALLPVVLAAVAVL
ncbi:MAG: cell division protein FtsK, partial [Actinomycetota bacterium]|nr:cell division protein FtsK [Actinomycetota bacterium]